jgi:nicotinamide riboside transporter PnuC
VATVGVWLNARQRIEGFYLWLFTNAAWFAIDVRAGMYGQAAMFAVYFVLTVYGIVSWKHKAMEQKAKDSYCVNELVS